MSTALHWNTRRLPEDSANLSEIYDLLYQLGLTASTTGFFHTAYAVYLARQQPERLLLVSKWLYPAVARHYATTWMRVERSIRTAADVAWSANVRLLEKLARRSLHQRPRESTFIAILALYSPVYPAA